ncbi:hypothetical protein [Chryseobacterium sp. JM1]|nr:hypothetical protein [Chryseobacterium sp. JM1]
MKKLIFSKEVGGWKMEVTDSEKTNAIQFYYYSKGYIITFNDDLQK